MLDESPDGPAGGRHVQGRPRARDARQYGFRLPSALDNRPLKFDEFEGTCVHPRLGDAEVRAQKAGGVFVEQLIRPNRPAGSVSDPPVSGRWTMRSGDHARAEEERARARPLTKRMA